MRALAAIVLAASIFAASAAAPRTSSPTELAARATQSLVRITFTEGDDTDTRVCTGFVASASRGIVLTVRHCVPDSPNTPVFVDGQPSTVLAANDALAAVAIPRMQKPPLDIEVSQPSMGDEVTIVGYGYGVLSTVVRHVSLPRVPDEDDVVFDGTAYHGMSGGPALNSVGRVIAIMQMSDPGRGYSAGCAGDALAAFLKQVK